MKLFLSLMGIKKDEYQTIVERFDSLVEGYHLDIMDGIFVESKTDPLCITYALMRKYTKKPLWVHLMTSNSHNDIAAIRQFDHTTVSFHIETKKDPLKTIIAIKERLGRPSLAISPKTSIFDLQALVGQVDHITVMSVNPGASGQKFKPESITKIESLGALCKALGKQITIACDGGIDETNIKLVSQCGVSEVAISNAIFKYKTVEEQMHAIQLLRTHL